MKSIRSHVIHGYLSKGAMPGKPSIGAIPSILSHRPPFPSALKGREHKATFVSQHAPVKLSSCEYTSASRRTRCTAHLAANHRNGPSRGRALYSAHTAGAAEPTIHNVFESKTGTWQYIVADPSTSIAVIIDPVLDYDPASQAITTDSANILLSLVKQKGYTIDQILETHAHADHLTAAAYLQKELSQTQGFKPAIGIGKRIGQVQTLFGQRYEIPKEEWTDVFDKLFDDNETFNIGELTATALHLPGHTPDHLGYQIGDHVFCGDSLFHADIGTARCDFPGGDATHLFNSGRRLLALEDHVKIWPGHDYPPEDRAEPVPWMSVREHRIQNKHLRDAVTQREFVDLRTERDTMLKEPRLLHQALQINIRAGRLPRPKESGHRFLRLPLKLNGLDW